MSYCAEQILGLATDTWNQIGSPTSISVGWISGVYSSSGHLGALNNRLTTCMYLSGDSPCIVGMGAEEASIYQLSYLNGYYRGLSASVMGQSSITWTRLREGDSSVERESSVSMSKAYTAIWQENNKQLNVAVANYKLGVSIPRSIDSAALPGWPTP